MRALLRLILRVRFIRLLVWRVRRWRRVLLPRSLHLPSLARAFTVSARLARLRRLGRLDSRLALGARLGARLGTVRECRRGAAIHAVRAARRAVGLRLSAIAAWAAVRAARRAVGLRLSAIAAWAAVRAGRRAVGLRLSAVSDRLEDIRREALAQCRRRRHAQPLRTSRALAGAGRGGALGADLGEIARRPGDGNSRADRAARRGESCDASAAECAGERAAPSGERAERGLGRLWCDGAAEHRVMDLPRGRAVRERCQERVLLASSSLRATTTATAAAATTTAHLPHPLVRLLRVARARHERASADVRRPALATWRATRPSARRWRVISGRVDPESLALVGVDAYGRADEQHRA